MCVFGVSFLMHNEQNMEHCKLHGFRIDRMIYRNMISFALLFLHSFSFSTFALLLWHFIDWLNVTWRQEAKKKYVHVFDHIFWL